MRKKHLKNSGLGNHYSLCVFLIPYMYSLVEAMEAYRDQTEQEQLPQFSNEFPYSITVDQAVATWKHIVLYQEKLRRD